MKQVTLILIMLKLTICPKYYHSNVQSIQKLEIIYIIMGVGWGDYEIFKILCVFYTSRTSQFGLTPF